MSSKSKGFGPGGVSRPGRIRPVISAQTGKPLLCTWDDCHRIGDKRIQIRVPKPEGEPGFSIFVFCSDIHRQMFYIRSTQHPEG